MHRKATLLVLGHLFSGGNTQSYVDICGGAGIPGLTRRGYEKQVKHLMPKILEVDKDSLVCARLHVKAQVDAGRRLIVLFDGAWLQRRYTSAHGSACLVDY